MRLPEPFWPHRRCVIGAADKYQRPKPWLVTTIASYLALCSFVGFLGGFASLRWDFKRILWEEAESPHERTAIRPGSRFWPGFWVGSAIGVLFVIGYHLQHGRDHLDSRER